MQDQEATTRQCPFCKEEIKADAVRCKHCQATFPPEKPTHGGVCPFCKEDINPEAIKCMHCKSNLAPAAQYAGSQERGSQERFPMHRGTHGQPPAPFLLTGPRAEQRGRGCSERTRPIARMGDPCNDYEITESGYTYCLLWDMGGGDCLYYLCGF